MTGYGVSWPFYVVAAVSLIGCGLARMASRTAFTWMVAAALVALVVAAMFFTGDGA